MLTYQSHRIDDLSPTKQRWCDPLTVGSPDKLFINLQVLLLVHTASFPSVVYIILPIHSGCVFPSAYKLSSRYPV